MNFLRSDEEMATTDKLTGLANRQAFELLVPQAIREALISRYRDGEMLDQVIARAEKVPYAAKGEGRNRVLSADVPAEPPGA